MLAVCDSSLPPELLAIEADFLSSVFRDGNSWVTFQVKWSAIWRRVQQDAESGLLPPEAMETAGIIAGRFEVLAASLLEQSAMADSLSNVFVSKMTVVFKDHLSVAGQQSMTSPSPPPSFNIPSTQLSPCPSYIASAYEWLLKNLHNPYPSHEVRSSISLNSNASLKQVTSWFTNIRRRIRWTNLSRKLFFGSCSETIDAPL
jgi:hypothetical protein